MTNLAGLPPLGLKIEEVGDDPDHLRKVRSLPCCICEAWGLRQLTTTEAHHTICGRYSQRKVSDRKAIPLCYGHHQGDRGICGIHKSKTAWVALFGPDTDWIAPTLDKIEAMG